MIWKNETNGYFLDGAQTAGPAGEQIAERRGKSAITDKLQEVIAKALYGFANEQENSDIFVMVQREDYENLIKKLKDLKKRAGGKTEREAAIQEAINRIEEMKNGEVRFEIKK